MTRSYAQRVLWVCKLATHVARVRASGTRCPPLSFAWLCLCYWGRALWQERNP